MYTVLGYTTIELVKKLYKDLCAKYRNINVNICMYRYWYILKF